MHEPQPPYPHSGPPPEPVSEQPEHPAPPRRTLPAAALAALYMLTWFFIWQLVGGFLLVGYIAMTAVIGGRNPLEELQVLTRPQELPIIPVVLITGVVGLASGLFLIYLFGVLIEGRRFSSFGFERVPGWGMHWAAGLGLDAGHMSVVFLAGLAAGWYHVVSVSPPAQALLIFVVAVLVALPAAAAEEVTMRGYVLPTLERRYGAAWGVAVNSLVFALLHLGNPGSFNIIAVLGLFLAGVYFSVAYLATRQLWLPIAGHTIWNVFEGPVFGLPVSGMRMPVSILYTEVSGPPWLAGGQFGPEGGLIVVVTTALWIPLVWWVGRRLPGTPPVDQGVSSSSPNSAV